MAESAPGKTLYLIDGHAQFFRAYHAIRTGMSSPVTKEPTNMTFGFTGMLLKLFREYRPDYVAVVIDASGDRETFRSEIYPEYKATRTPPPDDFGAQVARCLEILEAFHIPVIAEEGVEADDVIASVVDRLRNEAPEDVRIRIVTKDKDLAQLVNQRVELFDVHTDKTVTPSQIFKSEGVEAEQVRDILALMGDSIDNIPGVPGIGPKTAAMLIKQYGSIDGVYAHLDEIRGKRRENLERSREAVKLSRELVNLRRDCDVKFSLDQAAFDASGIDAGALRAIFRQLGFNRHEDDLLAIVSERARQRKEEEIDGAVFADSLFGPSTEERDRGQRKPGEYEIVRTEHDLADVVQRIQHACVFAFDTETTSLSSRAAELCGISISLAPETAVYIPVRSPEAKQHLSADAALAILKPVFEDASIAKIGHNLKFDLNILRRMGVTLRGQLFDTMVASYVLDASRTSHSLGALSLAYLDHHMITLKELIGSGRKQKSFDEIALEPAAEYAAEDADIAYRLHDLFSARLDETGLRKLFDEVEMPLVPVLAELEWNGIRVDPVELDRQRESLAVRIEKLRQEIIDKSPHPFNPDSPKQLAAALFNKPDQEPPGLGIRPLKRGKTGPSTDIEVLERIAANPEIETPVPQLVVEYRQLTKLVNTYLVALKDAIDPQTGRVHASFNQTVAATGRLSSSDPNLQNIPIRTDVGREIRRAFVAEPGNVLITADYSQIELRVLAHLSEDPALIEAFVRGDDIHTAVASEVFRVARQDVTPAQRNSAKMVNFGIIYGITARGLARRLGPEVTIEEAREIITNYRNRFRLISDFLDRCIEEAETKGYVETMLGRRRAIPQIRARNPQQRSLGERMAINSVVQGSAADLIKLAMIRLHDDLPGCHGLSDEGAKAMRGERGLRSKRPQTTAPDARTTPPVRMLLQIHDELVFECPREEGEQVRQFVVNRMEHTMPLRVPLHVDSAVSESWIDAK